VTTAYEAGESAKLVMEMVGGGCLHRQAEPVILSTDEHVACVCITCYRQLPPTWILDQRARAEHEAYCKHDQTVDVTPFGKVPGSEVTCLGCGAWLVG
jgi:hypothetical protein